MSHMGSYQLEKLSRQFYQPRHSSETSTWCCTCSTLIAGGGGGFFTNDHSISSLTVYHPIGSCGLLPGPPTASLCSLRQGDLFAAAELLTVFQTMPRPVTNLIGLSQRPLSFQSWFQALPISLCPTGSVLCATVFKQRIAQWGRGEGEGKNESLSRSWGLKGQAGNGTSGNSGYRMPFFSSHGTPSHPPLRNVYTHTLSFPWDFQKLEWNYDHNKFSLLHNGLSW